MEYKDANYAALSGAFIVLDGGDGSGKTTLQGILAEQLSRAGLSVTTCKDPGGTEIGNRIRGVLLDHDLANMASRCETLLFMASRAQLVHEVVRPALADGGVVLCDRYVSSTCAYQGAIGADKTGIIELADYATGGTWPDLTVIIDVPVDLAFERVRSRNMTAAKAAAPATAALDAMERRPRNFHEQVRRNFLDLAEIYPSPICIVDGIPSVEQVARAVLAELAKDRTAAIHSLHSKRFRGETHIVVTPQ